ncbi:nicotinate-nucleotide--dimethylbenzimidazole phosphoribosyltransferase [Synechococcus sp. CBW1004]|uniref:nicotinate-nucleotide--dimethylbenzimidazole phosphoribosyltransferase n=1 Tax=Synechococcus sp. CBW1004 TaxID=1353136 RepID=UPI0018CCBF4F|nr:TIGR00303 family protein [Synechococcus sp. CBW1004]QPN64600.1 TIGR00303 family protein [Synechococcus sp. CBW1004]
MSAARRLCGPIDVATAWQRAWAPDRSLPLPLLLLAATETAAVEGISAAGSTPESRRRTAAADAELLLYGPLAPRPHALPPLPAGVSPALISHVVIEALGLEPLVIDLGCSEAPAVPHLRPTGAAGGGVAACLSGGAALPPQRVEALLQLGRRWGQRLVARGRPLLLAECVPGGTSTAQALLSGLGLEVEGLVSGSLREPAHGLKSMLVRRGLTAARLPAEATPAAVVAAVGDAMQPLAASLTLTTAAAGLPVLLAGGSQMAAVLALALALAPAEQRQALSRHAAVVTTAWVAEEAGSDLERLLARIGERWQVEPLAFAAGLRFGAGCHRALRDYERGYVKEGVGAGGLALLWQLRGGSPADLAAGCDRACRQLLGE